MPFSRRLRLTLLLTALCAFACAAHAGSITFYLELTGTKLALINTGDSTAFFPRALMMHADGRWQPVLPPPGQPALTQLAPGARMELAWPDVRPLDQLAPLERLRPVMVRFFDQAGVGFGQISLFTTPPAAAAPLAATYADDALQLSPPQNDAIRATWVLRPQEEGIAGIRTALKSDAVQPPARRIDWRQERRVRIDTGAGMPPAILIHETAQGYRLQQVAAGREGGRQQRALWLAAGPVFYALASGLAAMAMVLVVCAWWRGKVAA